MTGERVVGEPARSQRPGSPARGPAPPRITEAPSPDGPTESPVARAMASLALAPAPAPPERRRVGAALLAAFLVALALVGTTLGI